MTDRTQKSLTSLIKPVVFIAALLIGSYMVVKIEQCKPSDLGFYRDIFQREVVIQKTTDEYPLRATLKPLTEKELEYARIAWRYFENNYDSITGFVNSVDHYFATTLWDLSSSLHATLSAYEIGIIDYGEMDNRLSTVFSSFLEMPLYQNKLPNKVYNAQTLAMTTYDNRPTISGVGWSSMDLGRFLGLCYRIINHYPQYTEIIKEIQRQWDFEEAIENATLYGIGLSFKDGVERRVQEGKLGYEEYSAKGFSLMGYDVINAIQYTDFIKFVTIEGVDIAVDSREVRHHPSYNYILSDPYILDGLEYGFDVNSRELAYRVFMAQKRKHQRTDRVICVGEGHIDREPWFVYNSVYVNGKKWHCVSESGEPSDDLKTFSTGAAFGWYYLFEDNYAEVLMDKARELYNEDLGWYSGVYHKTEEINTAVTANVNAMVLQALNYRMTGKLNS